MSGGYRTQLKIHGLEPGEIPLEGEAIWDPIGRKLGFWDFDNSEITWFRVPKYGDSESYIPNHRWVDTSLQFQDADGNWGEAVNLYGGYIENIDTLRNNDNSYTFKFTTQGPNGQEIFTVTTDPIESYYKGTWNALSNSPVITSGQGVTGEYYVVNVPGSTNIDNEVVWNVGDQIRFNGAEWERIPIVAPVTAVNGKSGNVVLTVNDISGVVKTSQIGAVNGVAPLDSNAKIDSQYLPIDGSFLGAWNANTNTPTITSSIGTAGQYYIVSVVGSTNVNGTTTWGIGDQIRFNGTIWQRIPTYQAISSVNGKIGVVTLTADDIPGISTVGKTGNYADLSGKPTLGTAAATNTTAYATAAQGTKADTALQPGSGVYSIESRDAAVVQLVPTSVAQLSVIHAGRALDYVRDASGTALETADGAKWRPNGKATPHHFGWSPAQSPEDQTTAIEAMLRWGGDCELPDGYTYVCNYINPLLTRDTKLTINGTLLGSADSDFLTQAIMRVDCGAATKYRFELTGFGLVDCSHRQNIPDAASGSAIIVRRSKFLFAHGPLTIKAGDSFDTAVADTGLVPEYCERTVIDGLTIIGFADHGIYATGGPTGDVTAISQDLTVSNCTFIGNVAGDIRFARDLRRTIIANNTSLYGGRLAINTGGGTNPTASSEIVIVNNICQGSYATAIDIRWTAEHSSAIISGNQIYDWGLVESPAPPAIRLLGVRNHLVYGNTIMPRDQTEGGSTTSCGLGVYINDSVSADDGLWYYSSGRLFANTIKVFARAGTNNGGIIVRATSTSFPNYQFHSNTIDAPSGKDYALFENGVDKTATYPNLQRSSANGVGFGGVVPRAPVEVGGRMIVSRRDTPARLIDFQIDDLTLARIRGMSPPAAARVLAINATTDDSNSPVTGGAVGLWLQVLGQIRLEIDGLGYVKPNAPTFANNAAASAGGVPVGAIYKTATGELRIRV